MNDDQNDIISDERDKLARHTSYVVNSKGVSKLLAPEVRVRDPLSDVTRKERRSLLGISALALVVVNVGLLPSKINALGIEFDSPDKQRLLRFLALIILFYLIAFIIYAASDFIKWRSAFIDEYKKGLAQVEGEPSGFTDERALLIIEKDNYWRSISKPISIVRAIFEFIVPIIISNYSIYCLLTFHSP